MEPSVTRCPRCSAPVSGDRCGCGWDAVTARKNARLFLLLGIVVDFAGTLGIVLAVLQNRSWLPVGIALMILGSVLMVTGILRQRPPGARSQPS